MTTTTIDSLSTLSVSQLLPISYFRILCVLSFLSSFSVIRESNGHDKPHLLVRMFSSHYQTVLSDCLSVCTDTKSVWMEKSQCMLHVPDCLLPFLACFIHMRFLCGIYTYHTVSSAISLPYPSCSDTICVIASPDWTHQ